jgi:hypothetical protein
MNRREEALQTRLEDLAKALRQIAAEESRLSWFGMRTVARQALAAETIAREQEEFIARCEEKRRGHLGENRR